MAAHETASQNAEPAAKPRRRNGTATRSTTEPAPTRSSVSARIVPRADDGRGGPAARILVSLPSGAEVDITRNVVASIAHALWEARGDDHVHNWLDAEAVMNDLLGAKPVTPPSVKPGRAASAMKDIDDLLPDLLPRAGRSRRL